MNKTKICWTDLSWNVVTGCSRGCSYCYAKRISTRFNRSFDPTFHKERLTQPLERRKPSRIFACSMGDLFDPAISDRCIEATFGIAAITPHHTYQVLTKRPERACAWMAQTSNQSCVAEITGLLPGKEHPRTAHRVFEQIGPGWPWPLPNVWLGTSITNQPDADERIPQLMQTPAAVKWLSIEPLLGPVDLSKWLPIEWSEAIEDWIEAWPGKQSYRPSWPDWVVVGKMTGPGAIPPKPEWIEGLISQCRAAGVPIWVKDNLQWPERIQELPEVQAC